MDHSYEELRSVALDILAGRETPRTVLANMSNLKSGCLTFYRVVNAEREWLTQNSPRTIANCF